MREILATVLLAVAAVATAWSSYQAARWNGEQAKTTGSVNAVRAEATRAQGLAEAQTQVDVATFIAWVDADVHDDAELATFYEDRFRAEFQPAFDAWLATDPLVDPDAPPTPFAMPEYELEAEAEADKLDAEAAVLAAKVRVNIQRGSNYVLGVVLFVVALFFVGMSTKLRGPGSEDRNDRHRHDRVPRRRRMDRNVPHQPLRLKPCRPWYACLEARVTGRAGAAGRRRAVPAGRRRSPVARRRSGSSSRRDGARGRRARPTSIGTDTGAPGAGPGAERRDERLVDGVLRVVEAGPAASLGLLPLPAHQLGHGVADGT